jgi:hypothetical protein
MSTSTLESKNNNLGYPESFEPTLASELSMKFINEGERKTTSFKVNAKLHRLLKACAALKDRQEGDLLNEAIADLLVKYKYLNLKD